MIKEWNLLTSRITSLTRTNSFDILIVGYLSLTDMLLVRVNPFKFNVKSHRHKLRCPELTSHPPPFKTETGHHRFVHFLFPGRLQGAVVRPESSMLGDEYPTSTAVRGQGSFGLHVCACVGTNAATTSQHLLHSILCITSMS
eukprot:1139524-Pelagomonas_calceolata.AAC.8